MVETERSSIINAPDETEDQFMATPVETSPCSFRGEPGSVTGGSFPALEPFLHALGTHGRRRGVPMATDILRSALSGGMK